MTINAKIELVNKLKSLVIFQKDCLDKGAWDEYDKLENSIRKTEECIIYADSKE